MPERSPVPAAGFTRRRALQGAVVGGGAFALGVLGITVLPQIGDSPVDIVGSARAAAAPRTGGILHTVVRFEPGPHTSTSPLAAGPPGTMPDRRTQGTITGTSERWTTNDPFRDHLVRYVSVPGRQAPVRWETSYADGTRRERLFWQQDVVRIQPLSAEGRLAVDRERRRGLQTRLVNIGGSSDPVAVLRALLNSSLLRPAGTTDVDGRPVRRLIGRDPGHPGRSGMGLEPADVEVLVDADDFTPVRVSATRRLAARPGADEPAARVARTLHNTWTFERYEHLPLDDTTAALLRIPVDGRRVVHLRRW